MANQNATVDLKFSLTDCNLNNGYYFIQINRMREMGDDACYRTEVVKKESSTLSFHPFRINIQPLCNGDTVYIYIIYLFIIVSTIIFSYHEMGKEWTTFYNWNLPSINYYY